MASVRSIDFLPEIFQTPVNRQFLAATLDQLIQEPQFQQTQGFVGRKVGPGVNPIDRYVIEPTAVRNEYQLEPGVIGLDPVTTKIKDVITYPGITDALTLQGAITDNANRLYTSEYYSWDPFVDFDKFVNYQQYYWLPAGPLEVDVSAVTPPMTMDYVVTRANNSYTFSGTLGNNPVLTLVRGGNYNFQVAQNAKETINFRVSNQGISSYIINYEPNPVLTLVRGNTYIFTFSLTAAFPFYIKTLPSLGNINAYNSGVTNNGASIGTLTFVVPQDAPDTLYYCSSTEFNMRGTFNIIDGTPGTGPGFWIQTDPGINGRIPATPNISSRDVLGVTNNGEDLGTVNFTVPLSTAQTFYYDLTNIGSVDLITNLQFDQINNQPVVEFLAATGGIDGITDLNNRSLVFQYQATGWDTIPEYQWYSVWKITYVTVDSIQYIQLASIEPVSNLEKFAILYGTVYSSTQWYKTTDGIFNEIPLLTAVRDVLFYQDGSDPTMVGLIHLIDQSAIPVLDINSIIGASAYTSPNGVIFTNGLKVVFRGAVSPSSYQNESYYVEGVGTAIKLLPVVDFVTPETYIEEEHVSLDITDSTLPGPIVPDYVTINRASPDLNPWTRSNRWFHIDVITSSAEYNNIIPVVDNAFRGRRPILEFRAGTKLFNFGTQGKAPINVIDYVITDAFSTVNGTTGYGIDGYSFVEGTTVVFAADTDPDVRNKIYQVQFVSPDSVPPLIAEPIINLVVADNGNVLINQSVVCVSGITLRGQSFYYDGVDWLSAQEKISVNQPPLFDVYDSSGISFSNRVAYPSTTFLGSKLLSYANPIDGTGVVDPVLGYALKYLSLANVGDIVFENNLYVDTFIYVVNSVSTTTPISSGFVRQYSNRVDYVREIGWQTAVTPSLVRQQFQFTYDGTPLQLDIKVTDSVVVPSTRIFVNSIFQNIGTYTVSTTDTTTTIVLLVAPVPGSIVEVVVLSDQISATAFYQVPINLSNNPLNGNSSELTLGTIRSHYGSIAENLLGLQGPINGANNTRDLGNIVPYGLQLLQQSSPLTLTGYFTRNLEYDIFASIAYNSREYITFKSQLLNAVIRNEYDYETTADILDSAIAEITQGRTNLNPFYWSDMLPAGTTYTQTVTTVNPISTPTFNTTQTYNFTSANYLGLLVYFTSVRPRSETVLLVRDVDYIVSTDGPSLTVTIPLAVGDVITIREYSSTVGNFVPNTPTKLGLYPKYRPRIFYDTNYVTPTLVIQGHDGSITVTFGDLRDQVLLEFEKRIYDNLKTDGNPVPLTIDNVMPGFFRSTEYTQSEITTMLGESFLSWVGWNKLDYKTQDYIANNPFTYNYSNAGSKLTNQTTISSTAETPLLGAWRGIYRYFYDTLSPNTTPWEMLGFSEQPDWWEARYGPAPYTCNNLVLWDDLEAGLVADPVAPYILPNFIRPGLTSVIPVGTEGQLLDPLASVVGQYDPTSWRKSWAVGDGGPVEASWWSSSSYPFAVMRVLALTKPAEFFSLFADRDLYRFNAELDQYLYNGRYRLDASGIEIYGNGVSKASYINWIVDYNQQLGRNSTDQLTIDLANLDVRLCYRMAAFTNKQYLTIATEKSSPSSQNTSLILPDASYNLLLYKNQPFAEIMYSALVVERVSNGYAVYGYSTTSPYFEILASASNGVLTTVTAGNTVVRVPTQYTANIVQIPYGYVFTNNTVVVDFILSYGAYLESQGLIFNGTANGYQLNWLQMAKEFLYFSNQEWSVGTLINLNPAASQLTAVKSLAVVDTIESLTPENMLLDQNRTTLPIRDLVIDRNGNTFTITSNKNQAIAFLHLRFTNYEHMVVLDNVSIFADLLYDPITAARQYRIKIAASITTEWNGQLNAQGFILNNNNIKEWQPSRKYTKGEIVLYKNIYWSAQNIIQPKLNFEYADWVRADYTRIQEGLLPNLANKSDQLANSYNIYSANLEQDNDLLSFGLIGFRPRQYMAALNLDDVSQINLYQQFLPVTGTILAAEIFTRADLGKESGAYDIYENWGILAGTYGANANRSFIELRLNESLLQADPSIIQVVLPQQPSDADQKVLLSEVWRESFKLTSPDILPTTYVTPTDIALPSAGYVNVNDADIAVFSLTDPSSIAKSIDSVGIGTIIWVAKTNPYDWNIYRCERVAGVVTQVTDNLNTTSVVLFSAAHNLTVGSLIIIRYFNSTVDGVYRVLGIPGIQQVIISFSFINTNQTTILGNGLAFYLQTARVAQSSDVASLPYANNLVPGAKAWVDNNGNGHWEVLEKQNPFVTFDQLLARPPVQDSLFGYCVAQSANHFTALVGSPGIDGAAGSVYTYRRDPTNNYAFNIDLVLNAPEVVGFGNSLAFGNQTWGIVGASASMSDTGYALVLYLVPGSNDYIYSQLLLAPDQDFNSNKFGFAVAMSQDERWMYISSPLVNRVYAYGLIAVENQSVIYITTGVDFTFNYSDTIQINSLYPNQLVVSLNNLQDGINVDLVFAIDYVVDATSVVLLTTPGPGIKLTISRRQAAQIDSYTYYGIIQNTTSGIGTSSSFTVNVTRGVYYPTLIAAGVNYLIGDTLTILGNLIGGATPANDLVLTVATVDADGGIETFTYAGSGITNTATFQLNPYLYTATNIYSFKVEVDGQLQRPHIDYEFNNDSTESTQDLTFITIPGAGAVIAVTANSYWQYVDSITVPGLAADAKFGTSITTTTDGRQILIGSPNDDALNSLGQSVPHAGSVYAIDRSVVRYLVTDVTQLTYAIPGSFAEPVAVLLNNVFLTNTNQFIHGQFTVTGSNIILSNSINLIIGDILEIETNQFQEIQKIVTNNPVDESQFGYAVDINVDNNEAYIGAPLASAANPQSGLVQRNINQSRQFGVITSTIANPMLSTGDTLRINNTEIAVPSSPNQNITGLVAAINSAGIPNVIATLTPDLILVGDGITQTFNIGSIYSAAESYTTVVYVDDMLQVNPSDYTYNNTTQQLTFVVAPIATSKILVQSGRMTVSVVNLQATLDGNRLTVLPGTTGTAFNDLGFVIYYYAQTIVSPRPTDYAYFGSSVCIDTATVNLVVGAPNGDIYEAEIFDSGKTYFDDRSTTFFSLIKNSGVAYTFDYLPSAMPSITNPGIFVFGQQIYGTGIETNDSFGFAVNYRSGRLLVGVPGNDQNNGTSNYGLVKIFDNPDNQPAWTVIRAQQPAVIIDQISSVFTYNRLTSSDQQYFDYFNPLQGKILGVARRNIDYIGAVDPADYNTGSIHNLGTSWGDDHIGEIWWDTDTVRFIDPSQDNITYASRRWGQIFPGSRVDIYQWISSAVPPVNYVGPGVALGTISYTTRSKLNQYNIFETRYYFWVRGLVTIDTAAGKTLSTTGIASYIENPRSSGIPYIAPLNASTIAIYNAQTLISAQDTILQIEYDRQLTSANVHQEYDLIAAGRPDSFLNDNLYTKLQDSFCGATVTGAAVPDPLLSPPERYGVQYRPRQSMFVDRFAALKNYLVRANNVFTLYPLIETRQLTILKSSQPEPTAIIGSTPITITIGSPAVVSWVANDVLISLSPNTPVVFSTTGALPTGIVAGTTYFISKVINSTSVTISSTVDGKEIITSGTQSGTQLVALVLWNKRVANLEELSFQNLRIVPYGYRYLVASDSSENGLWTIYELSAGSLPGSRELGLVRVQNYNTPAYWYTIDWYQPGYNSSINPIATVPNYASLSTLSLSAAPVGSSVKVASNAQGKFEIYLRTSFGWDRVGLQDGTIQIKEEIWNYSAGNFGFDVEVFDAQYFAQEPIIETRKIIQSINEEIFIDDLLIERNKSLTLMFNFIYSEFAAPEWLIKTSLVDVDHKIRALLPFQNYLRDNQDFVLDYIQEVKPYHVQIREFNLTYNGADQYPGSLTDFDVPAYYNTILEIPQFVSPILLPFTQSGSVIQSNISNAPANAEIWTVDPWAQWYNNYLLTVQNVLIVNGGSGYTEPPVVTIDGVCTEQAILTAVINSTGQVVSVDIVFAGLGYATTPVITITGVGNSAQAVAVMGNDMIRSILTVLKYDRYQYKTTIVEWQPNVAYDNGTQVRYIDQVWEADSSDSTVVESATFNPDQWTKVVAGTLSGVDRTMGLYVAAVNQPGLSLPLLIDGVQYPGVQVAGPTYDQNTGFDVGNYDSNPFDNISYGPEGLPTYDPAILDAIYESQYLDPYLGTRPTDVNVTGGGYIDVLSSYAPEELIPGSEFDTLDMRVYTTPGSDWLGDGHGMPLGSIRYIFDPDNPNLTFSGLIEFPMVVLVFNVTLGLAVEPASYDWVNYQLDASGTAFPGDVLEITVVGPGGGNQLYNQTYVGSDIGNTVIIPFSYAAISEFVIYNGEIPLVESVDYTWASSGPYSTTITFATTYGATDRINLSTLGYSTIGPTYSWSLPVFQTFTIVDSAVLTYELTNNIQGTNPANIVVTRNGVRARPAAGVKYISNGLQTVYDLPTQTGYSQGIITDTEVSVYINSTILILDVDYVVDAWDGSSIRTITLTVPATVGQTVLISVSTNAQYQITGNYLTFQPSQGLSPQVGDIINFVTWNDTSEQDILTQVFVGPETSGIVISEGYDETSFSTGTISGDPGSYDYSVGATVQTNRFNIDRLLVNPTRLLVTLNGNWLFFGDGYQVDGDYLIIPGPPISATTTVVVTSFTQSVVPGAMAFRIFQDIRGVQATYRITPDTTTTLTQPVGDTDGAIYVDNIFALGDTNLAANIWGVLTIGGERIMYRNRDTVNNNVNGLLRGTAGTAMAPHDTGDIVYNMGRGNLLPEQFQNYIVSDSAVADGSTTEFIAANIDISSEDSVIRDETVEVYVGGIRVQAGYTITNDNPLTILFGTAPPSGVEITILVRRGVTWYQQGIGTASDGVPLQDTNTQAARFLRGL